MSTAELLPNSAPGVGASPQISWWENFLRAPHAVIRIPGQKPMRLATDSVRARPAISPNLSMMLGVNAINLGVWGTFFPRSVRRTLGLNWPLNTIRLVFGVREMVTGYSLAGDPTRTGMLWARVGADLFDLAVLRSLTSPTNSKRGAARVALGVVAVVTALDAIAAARMSTVKRTA